jgi:hypothetical protein
MADGWDEVRWCKVCQDMTRHVPDIEPRQPLPAELVKPGGRTTYRVVAWRCGECADG